MKKILIVDDDPVFRKLMTKILLAKGYKVQEAENGREAVAAIKEKAPDLMVLDLMMPEMTGYEVIHYLKFDARLGDLPIVVVTSKERAINSGISPSLGVEVCDKSADLQLIFDRITKMLVLSSGHVGTAIGLDTKRAVKSDQMLYQRERRMIDAYLEQKFQENMDRNKFLDD